MTVRFRKALRDTFEGEPGAPHAFRCASRRSREIAAHNPARSRLRVEPRMRPTARGDTFGIVANSGLMCSSLWSFHSRKEAYDQ
eukprot:scaffold234715_cov27-Tisochrysis_lutea.AAC.3